jgi:hypothetical protein
VAAGAVVLFGFDVLAIASFALVVPFGDFAEVGILVAVLAITTFGAFLAAGLPLTLSGFTDADFWFCFMDFFADEAFLAGVFFEAALFAATRTVPNPTWLAANPKTFACSSIGA